MRRSFLCLLFVAGVVGVVGCAAWSPAQRDAANRSALACEAQQIAAMEPAVRADLGASDYESRIAARVPPGVTTAVSAGVGQLVCVLQAIAAGNATSPATSPAAPASTAPPAHLASKSADPAAGGCMENSDCPGGQCCSYTQCGPCASKEALPAPGGLPPDHILIHALTQFSCPPPQAAAPLDPSCSPSLRAAHTLWHLRHQVPLGQNVASPKP